MSQSKSRDIAIVGIGCVFADSPDPETFWHHVASGHDLASEPDEDRWTLSPTETSSKTPGEPDKVISKRQCLVRGPLAIDLEGLDMTPAFLEALDPMNRLALAAAKQAWDDANTQAVDRSRVSVVLGNIALPTESATDLTEWVLGQRFERALFADSAVQAPRSPRQPVAAINRWVAGLPAGMVARALGLGGGHYALDAACSSSLYALKQAVDDLAAGRVDAALTGGLARPDALYTQMGFSQLRALSPTGRCSPFDHKSDGLLVGEGAGVLLLKRVEDARAAGDTIYAIVRGIGVSNDIDGNLLAPSEDGQLRAMRAAYAKAGWQPSDVDLIECHATATPIGDAVEFGSLRALWGDEPGGTGAVLGSVKSNVGHLLTGAGAAGLIKACLALQHKLLPPTANFERPSAAIDLDDSPFRVLTEAEPWEAPADHPRRVAVSGFGFGGTNAHILLEEDLDASEAPQTATGEPPPAVAIVGLGAKIGPWNNLRALRERVLGGEADRRPAPKRNAWGFEDQPVGYFIEELEIELGRFKIPPLEMREILPQQTAMLDVAGQALDDADLSWTDKLQTGVFVGIEIDPNTTNYHLRWSIRKHAPRWAEALGLELSASELAKWTDALCEASGPALNANRTMGGLGGIVASRIAREFGFGGPSYVLFSEETSGLSALEAACRAIQNGELECAVVGAVDFSGDMRAVGATELTGLALSPTGVVRPFDRLADGTVLSEGAVAMVLVRRDLAERHGERIYASVTGLGSSTSGPTDATKPNSAGLLRAMERAVTEAGLAPRDVAYVECHGSGDVAEDGLEAAAVTEFFPAGTTLGAAKADVGHTGAAAGLVSVLRASLALYHEIIPGLRGVTTARNSLDGMILPRGPRYWLKDAADGPRRAGVSALSISGSSHHIVLEEGPGRERPDELRQPLGLPAEGLFVVEAETPAELAQELERLIAVARDATGTSLAALSTGWWRERGQNAGAALGLALIATSREALVADARRAVELVGAGERPSGREAERIFFNPEPLGPQGDVAFVYPGSGSHYRGMGRDHFVRWPHVLRDLEADNERLRSQMVPELSWDHGGDDPRDTILAQVALGTAVTRLVRHFGIEPSAAVGYSLGETAALFSMGAWTERDEMLRRSMASPLFTEDLAGPCTAARRTWGLAESEAVDWALGVVDKSEVRVREALEGIDRAFLLIVNTPSECVVGGQRGAVMALVEELGAVFVPLHGVTTVHCEVARVVEDAYRELHLLETTPPEGVRFYSGCWGRSYEVTRDSAAASITDQAIEGINYPKVISKAWDDGARVFIEMGPGRSCTRMIGQILGDRPHAAVSACVEGHSATASIMSVLATAVAHRVPVVLAPLFADLRPPRDGSSTDKKIAIPVGREHFPGPLPRLSPSAPVATVATPDPQPPRAAPAPAPASAPRSAAPSPISITAALERMVLAGGRAHEAFLRISEQTTLMAAGEMQRGARLGATPVAKAEATTEPTPIPIAPVIPEPEPVVMGADGVPRSLTRAMCMDFAIGSVADVLGPMYAAIDELPTRVRLPDTPLMLVDRIVDIQAEPLSMEPGTLITEHDVLDDGWYLDSGRIATCIAIEAGQADLFLSGFVGIDLQTHGEAVYRLLDATVVFHDELPGPGDVIRYAISIENFFKHGETWFFRFRFDSTVDGRPLMTMRDGVAGFFSQGALDAGRGIVKTALDLRPMVGKISPVHRQWVPMEVESYDEAAIDALRAGDLEGAFGPRFSGLSLDDPLTLPGGLMTLVHRVTELDPTGGRFGIGSIVAEADIHPDDWFIVSHFMDDRVMPGTLMYECCLHTLRIFLLRMGWVGERGAVVAQPIVGHKSVLECRGQVLETTKVVTYEIHLKEIGYGPEPFVLADALMYADGKAIVDIVDMSLRLTGTDAETLGAIWSGRGQSSRTPTGLEPATAALYGRDRLLEFAEGRPSVAYGAAYAPFDSGRQIARLPRPPFLMMDRVVEVSGEPFVMKAGARCVAEVQISPDAWYFADNRQPELPFVILVEMALQPCGWLAAYCGSALHSDEDLRFRNLGGDAVMRAPVRAEHDVLRTTATMTNVSKSGGMIIEHFEFSMVSARTGETVYEGTSYFGFFTPQSLIDQVGIQGVESAVLSGVEQAAARTFTVPTAAPMPNETMRMVDEVDVFVPDGGQHGLGFIRGSKEVDPGAWFFRAHFYQDPVWPGSLGLESFLQLLKVAAIERWGLGADATFATAPADLRHGWTYRGQIVPTSRRVTVEAHIKAVEEHPRRVFANGMLVVDGRPIYTMTDLCLEVR